MQLIEKKLVQAHTANYCPRCVAVSYIDPTHPILLRRFGRVTGHDLEDDFSDFISEDNGQTWSVPRPVLAKEPVEGGFITHTEQATLYIPERDLLIHVTNDLFQPDMGDNTDGYTNKIRITTGTGEQVSRGEGAQVLISDFGFEHGCYISFCHPIRDSKGRVLVPIQHPKCDEAGNFTGLRIPALLIGEFDGAGNLIWHVGSDVPYEEGHSSRGHWEGAIAELKDGRLAMILRGCNGAFIAKPGYKWLTFSQDSGESWTPVVPLQCTDGSSMQSSANGSGFFRSIKNDKLYWMGNLAPGWIQPQWNWPRSPLYLCEVQEEPTFGLKRETIVVLDKDDEDDYMKQNYFLQLSNFKYYQDRQTGDLVFYMTRFGERGHENHDWMLADLYEYRVALD
jgi:hypothetical protein